MNQNTLALSERAQALRRAFDQEFVGLPRSIGSISEDLLAVRVAGDPYAIRLCEISGIFADRKVSPLPSPSPDLLGVAGFRGGVVPIYDLRVLLGYPRGEASRWILLCTSVKPVGFAFEEFEGHLRTSPEQITAAASQEAGRYSRDLVRSAGITRPIVHLGAVVEAIERRVRVRPPKE